MTLIACITVYMIIGWGFTGVVWAATEEDVTGVFARLSRFEIVRALFCTALLWPFCFVYLVVSTVWGMIRMWKEEERK